MKHVIRSSGLKVKSILTISSNQGIKEMIMHSEQGLSLLSTHAIDRDVQQHNLTILPLHNTSFKRMFSCVCSPVMENKRHVKAFKHILKQHTTSID